MQPIFSDQSIQKFLYFFMLQAQLSDDVGDVIVYGFSAAKDVKKI